MWCATERSVSPCSFANTHLIRIWRIKVLVWISICVIVQFFLHFFFFFFLFRRDFIYNTRRSHTYSVQSYEKKERKTTHCPAKSIQLCIQLTRASNVSHRLLTGLGVRRQQPRLALISNMYVSFRIDGRWCRAHSTIRAYAGLTLDVCIECAARRRRNIASRTSGWVYVAACTRLSYKKCTHLALSPSAYPRIMCVWHKCT